MNIIVKLWTLNESKLQGLDHFRACTPLQSKAKAQAVNSAKLLMKRDLMNMIVASSLPNL